MGPPVGRFAHSAHSTDQAVEPDSAVVRLASLTYIVQAGTLPLRGLTGTGMRRLFAGVTLAGLILAGLTGVALGLGSYTFYYGEGGSYLSTNPQACVNCHIMREQYDGWSKSSHHA